MERCSFFCFLEKVVMLWGLRPCGECQVRERVAQSAQMPRTT